MNREYELSFIPQAERSVDGLALTSIVCPECGNVARFNLFKYTRMGCPVCGTEVNVMSIPTVRAWKVVWV